MHGKDERNELRFALVTEVQYFTGTDTTSKVKVVVNPKFPKTIFRL